MRLRACVPADAGDYAVRDDYRRKPSLPLVLLPLSLSLFRNFRDDPPAGDYERRVTGAIVACPKGKEEETPDRSNSRSPEVSRKLSAGKDDDAMMQHHLQNSLTEP